MSPPFPVSAVVDLLVLQLLPRTSSTRIPYNTLTGTLQETRVCYHATFADPCVPLRHNRKPSRACLFIGSNAHGVDDVAKVILVTGETDCPFGFTFCLLRNNTHGILSELLVQLQTYRRFWCVYHYRYPPGYVGKAKGSVYSRCFRLFVLLAFYMLLIKRLHAVGKAAIRSCHLSSRPCQTVNGQVR